MSFQTSFEFWIGLLFVLVFIGLLLLAAFVAFNFLQYRFKNDASITFILVMVVLITLSIGYTLFCAGLSRQSNGQNGPIYSNSVITF